MAATAVAETMSGITLCRVILDAILRIVIHFLLAVVDPISSAIVVIKAAFLALALASFKG